MNSCIHILRLITYDPKTTHVEVHAGKWRVMDIVVKMNTLKHQRVESEVINHDEQLPSTIVRLGNFMLFPLVLNTFAILVHN